MPLAELTRVAADAIAANKLRSFLTTLGIIIGIAAVITMVALGEGAERSVKEGLRGLGTNVLRVFPGQAFTMGIDRGATKLTAKDAEALRKSGLLITNVSPEMQRQLQVELGRRNANASVIGAWPSYFVMHRDSLAAGRLFTGSEERGRRRVAVVGYSFIRRLGATGAAQLVGQTIRIREIPFKVVGVLSSRGEANQMQSTDQSIFIPLSTAQFRVFGSDRVESIVVQAPSEDVMPLSRLEIVRTLRRQHRLRAGVADDFTVVNETALLNTFRETSRSFSFLLAGIAGISLLVGGIGIMNIMLVSVTERTREIGIRRTVGARRHDILFQFLLEATTLCVAGGAVGVLAGVGGAIALQRLAQWETAVSAEAVVLALGFSAAVGVLFGLWPARRAARLDPVDALRYE